MNANQIVLAIMVLALIGILRVALEGAKVVGEKHQAKLRGIQIEQQLRNQAYQAIIDQARGASGMSFDYRGYYLALAAKRRQRLDHRHELARAKRELTAWLLIAAASLLAYGLILQIGWLKG